MGFRRRRVVGLPCDGPVGLKSTFAILEVQQEHDGSKERVVHRDASRESAGDTFIALCFELKNRFRPPTRLGSWRD